MNHEACEQKRQALRRRDNLRRALTYLFLSFWAVVVLFPFYWMVLTSLKSYGAYNSEHVPVFFTTEPTLENYRNAFTAVPLGGYLLNTLIFAVVTTAVMVVVSTLAAYAFARLRFRGQKPAVRAVFVHDDDPHRTGGHHQLRHHHQLGPAQQLCGSDPALHHLGVLYLSAQGKL